MLLAAAQQQHATAALPGNNSSWAVQLVHPTSCSAQQLVLLTGLAAADLVWHKQQ
jgi:hypothetical protein